MRIFLTGATGYIGAAVLDALVRGGHDVTALVRDNEKARRVAKRGAHPVDRQPGGPGVVPRQRRRAGRLRARRLRCRVRPRAGDRAGRRSRRSSRRRSVRAPPAPTAPAKRFVIYTSGSLDPRPDAGAGDRGGAGQPDRGVGVPARARAARARREPAISCARWSCGPASSTAAATAWSATSSSRRATGSFASSATATTTGRSSTTAIWRTSTRGWPRIADASGIFHANDEGDERVNDIVGAIKPYLPVKPDVRYVPIDEARHKMGVYADALALDQVVRSPRARALGWTPTLHSVAGNAARLLEEWRESRNVENMKS